MLSATETTLVIEQGITVVGKPLKDHLEAIDHYEAIRYVRNLNRLVVLRSRRRGQIASLAGNV
jgi:hypothetical protein